MIEIEKLSKTYVTSPLNPFRKPVATKALESVTLSVVSGGAVSIIGRNGAGKTTLLKILATLVLPDGGRAAVCGLDVVSQSKAARRRIGIVTGDERSFYWRLSGRENLMLFGALHDIWPRDLRRRAEELLAATGLSEKADAPVRSYSTGMRQRLALARCLLHEPDVLLLDEPNKGLDPVMQSKMIGYIRDELAGRGGRTVLLATHNLEEAAALGGPAALLEQGRLVSFAKPDSVEQLRGLMQTIRNEAAARASDGDKWL